MFDVTLSPFINTEISVTIKNISKYYNGQKILYNFNSEFENGRTFVLIGSGGCGKSTLLRLIVGLTKQDSGTINVDNELRSNSNHSFAYVVSL